MNTGDFVDEKSGRLVPTIQGQQAFVPARLPPEYDLAKVAIPNIFPSFRTGKMLMVV